MESQTNNKEELLKKWI